MIDVQLRCKPDSKVKGIKYFFISFVNCYIWLRYKPDSKTRVQDIFVYFFIYNSSMDPPQGIAQLVVLYLDIIVILITILYHSNINFMPVATHGHVPS
jgi:hypothetical protein